MNRPAKPPPVSVYLNKHPTAFFDYLNSQLSEQAQQDTIEHTIAEIIVQIKHEEAR